MNGFLVIIHQLSGEGCFFLNLHCWLSSNPYRKACQYCDPPTHVAQIPRIGNWYTVLSFHLLRMVMEPKYLAFLRRWLYTPIINPDKDWIIGSLEILVDLDISSLSSFLALGDFYTLRFSGAIADCALGVAGACGECLATSGASLGHRDAWVTNSSWRCIFFFRMDSGWILPSLKLT